MPTPQRTVFISDLHLCSNARLNDFAGDAAVAALVDAKALIPGAGERVDLVLLGDTFDLWQSVPDAECKQDQGRRIPLDFDPPSEIAKIAAIHARHPGVFEALARFAARPRCRLVVVTGNHDHVLVHPDVQARLRSLLGNPGAASLTFDSFYASDALQLYADHGSQYDADNAYPSWSSIAQTDEAAGYFFVKLFFNRIEFVDPRVENSPGGWNGVWHWLRRVLDFGLLAKAIRWFWQYGKDSRVVRKLAFLPGPSERRQGARRGPAGAAPAAAARAVAASMPAAPALLVAGAADRSAEQFFCLDPEMEEFFRTAYRDSTEVRAAVNEILEAQEAPAGAGRRTPRRGAPATAARRGKAGEVPLRREVPAPRGAAGARMGAARRGGAAVAARRGLVNGTPKDVDWAAELFKAPRGFAGQLSAASVKFVVFGHTHDALTHALPGGATYLNSGTWASPNGPLPVVVAEAQGSGAPAAALKHLVDGQVS